MAAQCPWRRRSVEKETRPRPSNLRKPSFPGPIGRDRRVSTTPLVRNKTCRWSKVFLGDWWSQRDLRPSVGGVKTHLHYTHVCVVELAASARVIARAHTYVTSERTIIDALLYGLKTVITDSGETSLMWIAGRWSAPRNRSGWIPTAT